MDINKLISVFSAVSVYISSHKKAIISGVILVIIIASVPIGLYLVEHPAIFGSRAAEIKKTVIKDSKDPKIGATKVIKSGSNNLTGTSYFLAPSFDTKNNIPKQPQSNTQSINHRGYIIELQNNSISEQVLEKEQKGVLIAGKQDEMDYKKQLEGEHALAKADILSKSKLTGTKITVSEKDPKIINEFFNVLNGLAIEASPAQIESIKSSKYVKKVSPNLEVKPYLDESVPLIGAPSVWETTNSTGQKITGKGVKIGIIDTGIDYRHPDLGGCLGAGCKVVDGYDFADEDNDPMDEHGHGTHVASIAAGNGIKKGVAPDASLVAYKVFSSSGWAYFDDIIAALDRSVDPNQDGGSIDHLDVVNLSLGANCFGYSNDCGPNDPLSIAVNHAVWRNIVVVVAAGNSGPSEKTIGSPAVASEVITVGASSKSDQIADFSSRGPVVVQQGSTLVSYIKPDVVAPGVNICAAKAAVLSSSRPSILGGGSSCDSTHVSFSGTSMATPHVAGAAALIKQAYPNLPLASYKSILKSSANLINFNPILAGGGRINLPAAIAQGQGNPPIAILDPIAFSGANRTIVGLITSQNLKNWDLAFSPIDDSSETNWTKVQQGTTFPQPYLQYSLNTSNVPGGIFKIRLQSEDNDGRKSREYGYLEVIKYKINTPQNSEIYRAGDKVPISIETETGVSFAGMKVEYAKEGENFVEIYNGQEKNTIWDTSGFGTGLYKLKFTVNADGTATQQEVQLYLDSTLKAGWPKYFNFEKHPVYDYFNWVGDLITTVDDLDGDGKSEIIVQTAGFPPKLWALNSDGTVRWSKNIRASDANNSGNLSMVLTVDLNNDGKKEILLHNFMFDNTEIQAYDYQGNNLPGWPVKVNSYNTQLVAADLDNDGSKEIIARLYGFEEKIVIISAAGQIINQWVLPKDSLGDSIESSVAVGNFDADPDLEIVVATPSTNASGFPYGYGNEGLLYVYNRDGTIVSGWPATFPGLVEAAPVVGDINKDGSEEIILGTIYFSDIFPDFKYGGLYAYNKSGQLLPGWPKDKGYNYSSTPALADLNKDGYLEIVASKRGEKTEIYKYDGSVLTGWPQSTHYDPVWWGNNYYTDITSDIDGDGELDVLSRAGGRIFAWNKQGNPLSSFPKVIQVGSSYLTVKDIDNNGKAEIISSAIYEYDFVKDDYKNRGGIYVWEMPTNFRSDSISWPTYKQNELRTGRYPTLTPFVCTACAADISKDGWVTGVDVSALVPCMNKPATSTGTNGKPCLDKDVNKDGVINQKDVDCMKEQYLKECRSTPVLCTACAADVNKDGWVTGPDVSSLIPCWNKQATASGTNKKPCADKDVNKDGVINQKDVDCMKEQFLKQCKPSPTSVPTPTSTPVPTPVSAATSASTPAASLICSQTGDINQDGAVNALDYNVWQQAFLNKTLAGDCNKDRITDLLDYAIWWQKVNL